ncbi:unnamed protein product, partial [Adineta ricciae]
NNVNINFKPFGKRETEVPDTRKDWTDGWFSNIDITIPWPFGKRSNVAEMTPEEIQRLFDGWFNNVNFNFKPFGKRDLKDMTAEEIQRLFDGWFNNVNFNFKPFGKRDAEPRLFQGWGQNWSVNGKPLSQFFSGLFGGNNNNGQQPTETDD